MFDLPRLVSARCVACCRSLSLVYLPPQLIVDNLVYNIPISAVLDGLLTLLVLKLFITEIYSMATFSLSPIENIHRVKI